MPAKATNLYNLLFLVKKIQFESAKEIADEKIMVSVMFLRYREQAVFKPVSRPNTPATLHVNAGKSFTFGLAHDTAYDLAKEFIINVNLDRVNPDERLSSAQIDVTKSFCLVFADNCSNKARTQVSRVAYDFF